MILGVHHPALAVPDLRRALDFYCGVLGFREVMGAELPSGIEPLNQALGLADAGCQVRMIRKGNSCIELFEFKRTEPGTPQRPVNRQGITHFALATDDFQRDYDELVRRGVFFHSPPFGAAPARFAYARDPFGNVFELLEHAPGQPTALRYEDED
jgi:catechol 2,3-dioxygenase-like lactoylglutathione lyase family enzyme